MRFFSSCMALTPPPLSHAFPTPTADPSHIRVSDNVATVYCGLRTLRPTGSKFDTKMCHDYLHGLPSFNKSGLNGKLYFAQTCDLPTAQIYGRSLELPNILYCHGLNEISLWLKAKRILFLSFSHSFVDISHG